MEVQRKLCERADGSYRMPIFSVPHAEQVLDQEAIQAIKQKLRIEGAGDRPELIGYCVALSAQRSAADSHAPTVQ